MAEVFGVISGTVGVAGFAFQIADGIRKLADFCRSVRDAPMELQDSMSELEDLAERYQEIGQQMNLQQQINSPTSGTRVVLDRILARCERNLGDLKALLADMQTEVDKRRTRGSIKIALKRDTFTKFQNRVERTKNSLTLSYTVYCNELRRHDSHAIINKVDRLASMEPQIDLLVSQVLPPQPQASTNKQGTHMIGQRTRQKRMSSSQGFCLSLRLPSWLLNHAWELKLNQATRGWDATFRVYNIVPWSSPFFEACRSGSLSEVRRLISCKEASVFDRTPEGDTGLHCVLYLSRNDCSKIARLFLRDGLGVDVVYRNNVNNIAVFWNYITGPPHEVHELYWMLGHGDQTDQTSEEVEDIARRLLCFDPTKTQLLKQRMTPVWEARSLEDRWECIAAGYFGLNKSSSVEDYKSAMGAGLLSQLWEIEKKRGYGIFSKMVYSYGYAAGSDDREIDLPQWRDTFKEAMRSNIGMHNRPWRSRFDSGLRGWPSMSRTPTTYMHLFLDGCFRSRYMAGYFNLANSRYKIFEKQEALHTALQVLATELEIAGLDLVEFGSKERQILQASRNGASYLVEEFDASTLCFKCTWYRLISFDYEPRPEDWRAWWSNPLDECSGEFWDMVEHPEQTMPGAWLDEEVDDNGLMTRWRIGSDEEEYDHEFSEEVSGVDQGGT